MHSRRLEIKSMAPWIKPAAFKSVATLAKIGVASVALTALYAGMERAQNDATATPVPGAPKLKHRSSGTW